MQTSRHIRRAGVVLVGLILAATLVAVASASSTVLVSGNPSPFATPACAAINNAQTALVADGTLATLIKQWLGASATVPT